MGNLKEYHLTVAVADYLHLAALPGVVWTHFPAGEKRDSAITGAKLKKMGLQPGWPDFIFCVPPGGKLVGLELKVGKRGLTKSQESVATAIEQAGGSYIIGRELSEIINALKWYGVAHAAADR